MYTLIFQITAEILLKTMKNAFYFTFKALLVLKIFKFCRRFGHVEKQHDYIDFNVRIAQYLQK